MVGLAWALFVLSRVDRVVKLEIARFPRSPSRSIGEFDPKATLVLMIVGQADLLGQWATAERLAVEVLRYWIWRRDFCSLSDSYDLWTNCMIDISILLLCAWHHMTSFNGVRWTVCHQPDCSEISSPDLYCWMKHLQNVLDCQSAVCAGRVEIDNYGGDPVSLFSELILIFRGTLHSG